MELVIAGAIALSAVFWILSGVAMYKHHETAVIWATYFAITFTVLIFFLTWQKRVWEKGEIAVTKSIVGNVLLNKPLAANELVEVNLMLLNGGERTAKNLSGEVGFVYKYDTSQPEPGLYATGTTFGPINLLSRAQIPILVRGLTPLPAAELTAIENGKEWLFFCGKGFYDGASGQESFEICWAYRREIKNFSPCSDLNNPNNVRSQVPADRPYIGMKELKLVTPLTAGQYPTIRIIFVNGGKTPASGFVAYTRAILSNKPIDEAKKDFPLGEVKSAENGSLLTPGMERRVEFPQMNLTITPERLSAINARIVNLYVIGEVHYRDIQGNELTFPIRVVYDPSDGGFAEAD